MLDLSTFELHPKIKELIKLDNKYNIQLEHVINTLKSDFPPSAFKNKYKTIKTDKTLYIKILIRVITLIMVLYEKCGVLPESIMEIEIEIESDPERKIFYEELYSTNLWVYLNKKHSGFGNYKYAKDLFDMLIDKRYLIVKDIRTGSRGNSRILGIGPKVTKDLIFFRLILGAFSQDFEITKKPVHILFGHLLRYSFNTPLIKIDLSDIRFEEEVFDTFIDLITKTYNKKLPIFVKSNLTNPEIKKYFDLVF